MLLHPKVIALFVPLAAVMLNSVDELIETGHRVSALPGQVVIAILLLIAIAYIVWSERTRAKERAEKAARDETRESLILAQISTVQGHHDSFVRKVDNEREGHRKREEFLTEQVLKQSERSIAAMENMTASTRSLEAWLRDNVR